MKTEDFTTSFLVTETPKQVFDAINDVRAWWINVIDGASTQVDDEFSVQFWDVHYTKQRLIELVPGKKVVWLITESDLSFVKDKEEWKGTRVIFDIEKNGDKTMLKFTHEGLVPSLECHKDCTPAWTEYINQSLFNLITTGKGNPTDMKKELQK